MANTLPDLIGDLYKAAEKVGAEGIGFLDSVMINGGSEAVAQGEDCKSVTTEAPTLNSSATPAMTIPEGDDQTFSTKSVTLDQVANVMLNVTGEEQSKLAANNDYETIQGNRFERAFRSIRNQIESHVGQVVKEGASRAYGTAGTTPFGSNFSEVAELRQILFDNQIQVSTVALPQCYRSGSADITMTLLKRCIGKKAVAIYGWLGASDKLALDFIG